MALTHLKTTLLFLLLIATMIILAIPLKIYKLIIIFLKKFTKLGPNLTPYDSIFAVDDITHPHAANVTVIFLKGELTLDKLVSHFEHKILGDNSFKKLSQIPKSFFGYYFWQNINFKIQNHIKFIKKFGLEDDQHENELFEFLSNNMCKSFSDNVPYWEVLLLNGYKNSQSVLIIRIHHVYADGYSQNFIVDRLLNVKSDYFVKQTNNSGIMEKLQLLKNAPSMLTSLYKDALTTTPNFYTKKKLSTTGVISMTNFDLNKFKEIRRKTNTHFASIGMSLMCGALRRYFNENDDNVNKIECVSIMHSLPKPGHPLVELVNHWGVGLFKIPIGLENGLERLLKTEEYFVYYLKMRYEELLHFHMPLLGWFPRQLLKAFFNINFGTSMGFTSVPAYQHKAEFGGLEVLSMSKVFGFQWRQTAVATAVYTHNSKVSYTMYANKDILPDQQAVNRVVQVHLQREFEQLYKVVSSRGSYSA